MWINVPVRKVSSTGVVTTIIGTGIFSGPPNESAPYGIIMDSHGNLYVSEQGGNQIKKITPGGIVTTFAGDVNGIGGNANGTGTALIS